MFNIPHHYAVVLKFHGYFRRTIGFQDFNGYPGRLYCWVLCRRMIESQVVGEFVPFIHFNMLRTIKKRFASESTSDNLGSRETQNPWPYRNSTSRYWWRSSCSFHYILLDLY